ncbi:unnamed protein product [Cunninghamella echinulata]
MLFTESNYNGYELVCSFHEYNNCYDLDHKVTNLDIKFVELFVNDPTPNGFTLPLYRGIGSSDN